MIFNHSTIQSGRRGPQLPNSQPMKWIWLSALLLLVTSAAEFGIQLQQQTGNHVAYQSLAQGLCVEILASCGVSQDCSPMTTYQCSTLSSSSIEVDADGVVDMVFEALVSKPWGECGEGSCPECTAYKSCVGPMVQTDQQMLNAGDCILWEYKTEGGSDAFEAGLRGCRSTLCNSPDGFLRTCSYTAQHSSQTVYLKKHADPRHPVIFSADDLGFQSPPKSIVFRFHYHSQVR